MPLSRMVRGSTFVHAGGIVWIAAVSVCALLWPDSYEAAMQEDRAVEWATVWLFLFAGAARVHRAIGARRVFDGLVALFCLFVAGEELSWGQRLIGYHPPEFFLEHNFQQEANLHNLPQWYLQPKWVLMIALAGYGILLPLLSLPLRTRVLLDRAGATTPPATCAVWFALAAGLLLWYPLTYTGEWIEAFAGGLFLFSAGLPPARSALLLLATMPLAIATASGSAHIQHTRNRQWVTCAQREVDALVWDVVSDTAGTERLWRMRRVHKRVWSSVAEDYLDAGAFRSFDAVACHEDAKKPLQLRRKYGIDPWGSPYWLEVERISEDERQVIAYSFGPNRRRDAGLERTSDRWSDDIRASAVKRLSK